MHDIRLAGWYAVMLLIFSCLLTGCSGSHTAQSAAIAAPGQLVGLPVLAGLTVPPHGSSAPVVGELEGWSTIGRSDWVANESHSLRLSPPSGELAFGLYRLATGGHPVISVSCDLQIDAGEVYIAIGNYDNMSWDFTGVITASGLQSYESTPAMVAPDDNLYLAVVAIPDSLVRVDTVSITVDQPGWQIYDLVEGWGAGHQVDLFVQDSKPMLVYTAGGNYIVYYRATDSFPTSADQWVGMTVDSWPDPARLGGPLAARSIDGRPAAVYQEIEEHKFVYAYATVAEPDSSDDWESVVFHDGVYGSYQIGLTSHADTPRIAFAPGLHQIKFAWADTSTPGAGDWTISDVCGPDVEASWLSASMAGNSPVIFCHADYDDSPGAYYLHAASAFPDEPGDWTPYKVHHSGTACGRSSMLVSLVKPMIYKPVVSFLDNYFQGGLHCSVGKVQLPTEPQDWNRTLLDNDVTLNDVMMSGGRPFVIYHDVGEERIKCVWSEVISPDAVEEWQYFVLGEGVTECAGLSCATIAGTPIVAYSDGTADVLKFGFYDG